jgi:hypothetical protein
MTTSAQLRDVGPVGFVPVIQVGEDSMFPVAVSAVGCLGRILDKGLAVTAFEVVFCYLGMAVRTVDTTHGFARTLFKRADVSVTLHARNVSVLRILDFYFVDH